MKQEMIHDALNLLDDDLIEAVEKLRALKTKRKLPWVRWASLAACLCLLAGLISLLPFGTGNTASDGIVFESDAEAEQEALLDYGMSNGSSLAGSTTSNPQVTVRIDRWQADGFLGTITESGIWEEGAVIKVVFEEAVPGEAEFPVGAVACVQILRSEQTDGFCIVYAKEIQIAE